MDHSNRQREFLSNMPTTLQSHEGARGSSLTSSVMDEEESEMDTSDRRRENGSRRYPSSLRCDDVTRNTWNCLYIPPGNHESENYRVATFGQYPKDSPVLPVKLAKAGFYYTGFKDRTKCFSCGLAVEDWAPGDNVFDARWHKGNCSMVRGEDHRNVPSEFFPFMLSEFLGSLRNVRSLQQSNATRRQGGVDDEIVRNMRQVNIGSQDLIFASITNEDHRRLLMNLDLKHEINRRKTYQKWPCYPAPDLPGELAKEGFFYLGNLDRTQCFACSGVLRNWSSDSVVREHHKRHFSNCRFHNGNQECGNVPMTDQERRDADEADRLRAAELIPNNYGQQELSEEEKGVLAQTYPCRNPVNPHMIEFNDRLATFRNAWTRNDILATPEQIARAGFFYLGESDKVKCFYCNGGLQRWERGDEPWVEHGKWFPNCEFVKRHKGEQFVRYLEAAHPNLNRPTPVNNAPYDVAPTFIGSNRNEETPGVDIAEIRNMGFSDEQIQRAIENKISLTGTGYTNPQDLIDDLLSTSGTEDNPSEAVVTNMEVVGPQEITVKSNKRPRNEEGGELQKKSRTSSPHRNEEETEELAKDLKLLQEKKMCKQCHRNIADHCLLPCGHLSTCTACSTTVKKCPLCKKSVHSKMKVYRV